MISSATAMDILPFVRFEEAYDPFQVTPAPAVSNVASSRSSEANFMNVPQTALPKMDFAVCEECYCLFVELPGLNPEDIQCVAQDNGRDQLPVLLIDAAIQRDVIPHLKDEFVSYIIAERSYGRVRRSVRLPLDSDTNAAVCSLKQGILTVVVPKRIVGLTKTVTID